MSELRFPRNDVAQCYYPHLFPAAAWCQFFNTVCKDKELLPHIFGNKQMIDRSFFTKAQVNMIEKHLGKPKLKIKGIYVEVEN